MIYLLLSKVGVGAVVVEDWYNVMVKIVQANFDNLWKTLYIQVDVTITKYILM